MDDRLLHNSAHSIRAAEAWLDWARRENVPVGAPVNAPKPIAPPPAPARHPDVAKSTKKTARWFSPTTHLGMGARVLAEMEKLREVGNAGGH